MNYTIGIIGGRGVMGKFFQTFFNNAGYNTTVWGRSSEISLQEFVQDRDIVIVSVPIDSTEKVIRDLGKFLRPDQCITDFTSLKKFPLKAMQNQTQAKYFGMHPMFAPPLSGSISGQNIVFSHGTGHTEERFIKTLFTQNKAICLTMEAEEHDQIMTVVQGLSHFLDIAFVRTLQKMNIPLKNIFSSQSPAYAIKMMMAGRTLYQDANLYGNIQMANPQNIKTLVSFFDSAQEIFSTIEKKSLPDFEELFEEGKKFLGKYAQASQDDSDRVIDFLAQCILPQKISDIAPIQKQYSNKKLVSEVGILGPKNTFSYIAAEKFFTTRKNLILFPSIPALFSAYKKEKISEIFVPIENMLHGSVVETVDGILHSDLMIQTVFEMKISPSLFVHQGVKKNDILYIYSHPQALAQCSDFLENNFPNAKFIPMSSTAAGVEKILNTPSSAVIAAPEIAEKYTLTALFSNIANTNKNATRFAYLSADNKEWEQNNVSSHSVYEGGLVFTFAKDAPGTLESVLHLFSENKINLTKIESRPTGEGFGEYSFFVTYSGILSLLEKKNIFEEIRKKVSEFRFLGEFEIIQE